MFVFLLSLLVSTKKRETREMIEKHSFCDEIKLVIFAGYWTLAHCTFTCTARYFFSLSYMSLFLSLSISFILSQPIGRSEGSELHRHFDFRTRLHAHFNGTEILNKFVSKFEHLSLILCSRWIFYWQRSVPKELFTREKKRVVLFDFSFLSHFLHYVMNMVILFVITNQEQGKMY